MEGAFLSESVICRRRTMRGLILSIRSERIFLLHKTRWG